MSHGFNFNSAMLWHAVPCSAVTGQAGLGYAMLCCMFLCCVLVCTCACGDKRTSGREREREKDAERHGERDRERQGEWERVTEPRTLVLFHGRDIPILATGYM